MDSSGSHLFSYSNGTIKSSITSSENNTFSHLDTREPGGVIRSVTTNPGGDTSTFVRKNQNVDDSEQQCGMTTAIHYTLDKKTKTKTPQTLSITTPAGLISRLDLDKTYVDDTDGLKQTATATSPTGRKATSTFDRSTLLISDMEFGGLLPTHFTYDTHGRLTAATTGARNISFGYDPRGNLTSVVDPLDRTTNYSYDLLDRPTRIDRPDSSTVRFQYDESGNLTVLTTPVPADNHFAYNGVNRVSGFTTPLGSVTSYVYDKERKLTAVKLPSGKTITNTYTHGRLSETTTAEWTNSYTYNCGDQPASISRGSEQLSFGYDGALLTSITQSGTVSGNIGLTYNNDFNLTSFSYAEATENYAYDNDGLLTTAGNFTIARRADNGLAEKVSSDSLVLNRSFNGYGEVEAIDVAVSGSAVFGYDLTRDNSGRITGKTETVNGTQSRFNYTYDDLGRLLTVTQDGALVEEYHYDANGNRISETNSRRGITNRTLTHSTEDHIITAGTIRYEFDLDDNLAARIDGSETTEYNYSSTGELLSVKLPDARMIGYINDPLGRRIAKKINGVVVEKYLWSGLITLLAVYDGSDTLLQRFEYADGRLPYAMTAGGDSYYLSYDQVGSLRLVADSSGAIVKRLDYDTFGNILSDSNPAFTVPFSFAGGLHDRDTGLVRFGFRDYLPEIGKWTAKDPIGFAGGDSNLYGYVDNDPVNLIDPEGLKTRIVIGNDKAFGIGTGHVGIQVDNSGDGASMIYDPSGSYKIDERGSDGIFSGDDADWKSYLKYQGDATVFTFETTPEEEKAIADRANLQGDSRGINCANSVSSAVSGIGPFKKVQNTRWPGNFARQLRKLKN